METRTIRLSQKTKKLMDNSKIHSRETYEQLIVRILNPKGEPSPKQGGEASNSKTNLTAWTRDEKTGKRIKVK